MSESEKPVKKEAKAKRKKGKKQNAQPPKPIVLRSIRGRRTWAPVRCHECGKTTCLATKYTRSNRGPVNICDDCKPAVRARSAGHQSPKRLDAMSMVSRSGLRF